MPLIEVLTDAPARNDRERADVERLRSLAAAAAGWDEIWDRSTPLHVTGSAFVVHPPTRRVLLRWHDRQQAWIQVGGHGDPGEEHPLDVARREATEETGLDDLRPWPDARLVHVAIVPVPANEREPAHEHADLRYVLATDEPNRARAEHEGAEVRWLSVDAAIELTVAANVKESLRRVGELLRAPTTS
ncbi:MAG: NUDIX domain-containing protein [Actinomycetota bacterium]